MIISLHLNVPSAIDLRIEVHFPFCNTYSRQVPAVKRTSVSSSTYLIKIYYLRICQNRRIQLNKSETERQKVGQWRIPLYWKIYALKNNRFRTSPLICLYHGLFSSMFKPNDIGNINNHEFLTLSLILPDATANVTNICGD